DINKKEVFYDKLTYIYLEMPKFQKTEAELETMADKWLYALKNLPRLLERPAALQERIFKKFFNVAEIGNLSKDEYAKYFESEKIYYDNDGAIRTAEAKGRAEGQQKEKVETVHRLSQMGLTLEQIALGANLTTEEVTSILS
ncbi:MAG: Rpn family recombination-promoting nuclease/putative transposase, partial [Prevotella sp.]|nr:Rpn family recombination-promoting nuclease/putative transposase [Prevotella sp.]